MREIRLGRPDDGLIIPTAMFVAMFVLLLAITLMASVSQDFDLSVSSVEKVEFRYRSLSAANLLISDLNAGLPADTYVQGEEKEEVIDGRVTQCWVEPLTGTENNYLVVARTYRQSRGPGQAQTVKRLVTYKEHTQSRVYTNVTDTDPSNPDPIYYNELGDLYGLYIPSFDPEWNVPPDLVMGLVPVPGTFALGNYRAGQSGREDDRRYHGQSSDFGGEPQRGQL